MPAPAGPAGTTAPLGNEEGTELLKLPFAKRENSRNSKLAIKAIRYARVFVAILTP